MSLIAFGNLFTYSECVLGDGTLDFTQVEHRDGTRFDGGARLYIAEGTIDFFDDETECAHTERLIPKPERVTG